MFTVKILNFTFEEPRNQTSVYLREWDNVEVWLPESQNYKDKVEDLKKEVHDEYHSNLESPEMTGEELDALIELQGTYKAFVTYEDRHGEDSFYCIAGNEEVYITDSNGNTVYSIR